MSDRACAEVEQLGQGDTVVKGTVDEMETFAQWISYTDY